MEFAFGEGQEERCLSSLAPPNLVLWWPEATQATGFKTNSSIWAEALQEPESSLISLAKSRHLQGMDSGWSTRACLT